MSDKETRGSIYTLITHGIWGRTPDTVMDSVSTQVCSRVCGPVRDQVGSIAARVCGSYFHYSTNISVHAALLFQPGAVDWDEVRLQIQEQL
jgi:hypothetical protein